ncbi:MAG: PQQ-binding-like beta-propeller repeat protein [Gemmataceae bacterium]
MSDSITLPAGPRRLWLPVVLVAIQLACLMLPYWVEFESMELMFGVMMLGPMVGAAGFALWWLLLSGIAWRDRLLGLLVAAVACGVAVGLAHETFRLALQFYGLTALTALWTGYLVLTSWLSWPPRRVGMVLTLLLAGTACTLFRMDGAWGNFLLQVSFRFAETAEDRYVKSRADSDGDAAPAAEPIRLSPGDWPGFRGPNRDGHVVGERVATDWEANPPKLLWKQPIGPGWSSFAVVGNRVYTQEQRKANEVVVCLDAETGKQIWEHKDEARFTEAVAGAGPRATPTFHDGKLYTLGAKGHLNCLDAATGKTVWSKDIADDSGATPPPGGGWWGFSSSPLVARGVVTVVASFTEGKLLLGYKADTGDLLWSSGSGKHSYSSPHLATLGGVEQVMVPADNGLTSFDPATGKVLWTHEWVGSMPDMARCTQPAVVGPADVLLGTGFKHGTRRLHVRPKADGWSDEEVWSSKAISQYFNDMVVYQGHIYGFDDAFFTCVNAKDGEKRWRARGYGNGQVLLLADQGLLLILAERGDVALLRADPEKHTVLGRIKAIEGKTWNHPVVAHGKLFVRNGEEVACFRLPGEPDGSPTK